MKHSSGVVITFLFNSVIIMGFFTKTANGLASKVGGSSSTTTASSSSSAAAAASSPLVCPDVEARLRGALWG